MEKLPLFTAVNIVVDHILHNGEIKTNYNKLQIYDQQF